MKNIGFLSFGHWSPSPQSGTRSASDALLQSIDLAVAAEELGADGVGGCYLLDTREFRQKSVIQLKNRDKGGIECLRTRF